MGGTYLLMGVSGSGKSTIGTKLAEATGGLFIEGDDYHPPENIAKMSEGRPLNDEDRRRWLEPLAEVLRRHRMDANPVFLGCSALKAAYRDILRQGDPDLVVIYLRGSKEVIGERMKHRQGHFMPASLVHSQFETLEEPSDAIVVDVDQTVDATTAEILAKIENR